MKLTKINLTILFQIIVLWATTRSDHVQVISCAKEPTCLQNLDQHLLEVIEENLENSTQPCEHFWNYACGSWTSAPYYDHVDNFGVLANYYADNLIKTLTKLQTTPQQDIQELVNQIMKYFHSCKSMKSYKLNMAPYLRELPLNAIFGGESFEWNDIYQVNEGGIWKNFNWLRAVAYLRKYGFKNLFIQETVGFAGNNSQQYIVELKVPYAKTNFVNKYKVLQIMEEFGLIFGHTKANNYLKLAQELYVFDQELRDLNGKYEDSAQDHFVSLQDFSSLVHGTDWFFYFKVLLNQIPPAQMPLEFTGNLKYFQDLQLLLEQKPKNIQVFYILIRFCQYLMDIRPLLTAQECMLHTNVMFPVGINYIYNRFLYNSRVEDEKNLQYIFSLLKSEFSKNLQQNKFSLSGRQQKYLLEKLKHMQLKIGNLPLIFQDINRYYSSVHLNKNNFYYNHLKMLKFRTLQQHQFLLSSAIKPVNLNTYYINDDISQLRNAPYFIHQRNMLIVPMVFLQLPFYHYMQHAVLQFSLVGWIMAHELSHAFDTQGLNFDAWGNKNLLGFQLSENNLFLSSVECLTQHSPTVSLNERMADVNGLQLAWQTFSQQITKNNGFHQNASLEKLFFINFAQFFCGSLPRPIGHDRDDIRVRNSIANVGEFAEVFQCSNEAKENPARKCSIWKR